MRKLMCCLMLLVTLIAARPACAQEGPVLPDPGPYVKVSGELLQTDVDLNGVLCNVYGYSFHRGDLSFGFVLLAYEWKITGMDFVWEKLSSEDLEDSSVSEWYAISKDGLTAYLNLTGKLLGKACTLTLYIPQGMGIALETKQNDATPFYNDSFVGGSSGDTTPFYNDSFVGGSSGGTTSFYNDVIDGLDEPWTGGSYSDGPTVCSYCHGSKKCPECHGSGHFRSPYTGSYLECSCDDGDCPICDGEGVW